MNIMACIQKIYPDWKGVVWNNSYDGIKPHELETRPIPTLAELEAVWPTIQAEQQKAIEAEAVKAKLAEIDLASIRAIREHLRNQPDAPAQLRAYEDAAVQERAKLL